MAGQPARGVTQPAQPPLPSKTQQEPAPGHFSNHLLNLYARGRLTAKDLCVSCYHAVASGCQDSLAARLAKPPGNPSGHYQRHFDTAIGPGVGPQHCKITIPLHVKNLGRMAKPVLLAAPHIALAAEATHHNAGATDRREEWAPVFQRHPAVLQAREDNVPIHPVALYLDGVRYTRSITPGRMQSFLGFFVYNLYTGKRHYIGCLLKSQMCRCGCRSWCSLYPIFRFLQWSFTAAASGVQPDFTHDGSPLPQELRSPPAATRFALVQIKGDWQEYCHSLGFPTWASRAAPCLFCNACWSNMYGFRGVSLITSPWTTHSEADYDAECRACEVRITVATEDDRRRILNDGGLFYDNRRSGAHGRALRRNIPALGLLAGDRLDPSDDLEDVGRFEHTRLPIVAVFWRKRMQGGACTDRVVRRNPLFSIPGVNPYRTLHIDVLHTLYLGVAQRYVAEVIARTLQLSPWGRAMPTEIKVQRLRNELFLWYDDHGIPSNMRLGDLTAKMLGSSNHAELKTKAAETGVLVPWAASLCEKYDAIAGAEPLLAAGNAYVRYMTVLRESPRSVPQVACQELMHCAVRHLRLLEHADVSFTPKHHLWLHLTAKIPQQGNPKTYATFLDESLNAVLAGIVASVRPGARFEQRVFQRVAMLPRSAANLHFAALP